MQELIKQLQHLKATAEDLLWVAQANKDAEKIAFYKGELQGIETAIIFAECQMKREEKVKMKFKELRHMIDDRYIMLSTNEGCFDEFNCDCEKYDDLEVSTIQAADKRIFVAVK